MFNVKLHKDKWPFTSQNITLHKEWQTNDQLIGVVYQRSSDVTVYQDEQRFVSSFKNLPRDLSHHS